MKIKFTCMKHPTSSVLFLEGTTKFSTAEGDYVTEQSETASQLEIDESNLYCTGDNPYGDHAFIPFVETRNFTEVKE